MGLETCKSSENSANSEMVPQRASSSSLCAVFNQTVDICCSVLLAWRSYLTGFKKCHLTGCEAFLEKMAKRFLGVEFVDILHVPLHRRLETLAVFQWILTFLYLGFISFFLCFAFLFTPLFFIPLGYLVWYVYDYRTPEQGGRRSEWVRNWRVWSYFRSYFPVTLHKTVEIDPSENYLFIYHPHGILSVGAFSSFGTNACGFNQLFPGLRSTLLTLKYQFTFPIQRDYCMALGSCTCSRSSIEWLLTRNGTGNAVVLVVGGASEALEARPDSFSLIIKQRKGFIRLALQHGKPLVPVYAFGENDLFNQVDNPRGSRLRKFQEYMKKILSFSSPIFHGRGMFNYTFGFMPFRRPVNVVVGSPLQVELIENPTDDQVDAVHKRYLDNLTELFETHKGTYGIPPNKHITFI